MSCLAVDFRSVVAFVDRFPVLAGVDLQVEAGECILLEGPNGAGKTSLLRALAGLLPVSQGTASVLGLDPRSARRRVGFLGHQSFLYSDLSVRENLTFAVRASHSDGRDTDEVLEQMLLDGRLADVSVDRLSAGQRRRVALAVLVARAPELLLLDEPQASLDTESRRVLSSVVEGAKQDGGRTVIFSSHEVDHGIAGVDRTVHIAGGQMLAKARNVS